MSPPTSMRSNASSTRRRSFVNSPACRPNLLEPARSSASSGSVNACSADHRREHLLARDLHLVVGARAAAWAGRGARRARRRRARARPPATASRSHSLDALGVAGADQRADVGRLVERVADDERVEAPREVVLEPVERLVVVDALHRDARLPRVGRAAPDDALGGVVEVGVRGDDDRGVAAELERHALHAGAALQPPADGGAAGEREQLDAVVLDERRGVGRRRRHDGDPLLGPAGLEHDLRELERADRRLARRPHARSGCRPRAPARPCARRG